MEKTFWKSLAIILLVLIIEENLLIGWGMYELEKEEKETYNCYYNTCSENYDADYSEGICTCYDLDMVGNYVIVKTEYLG